MIDENGEVQLMYLLFRLKNWRPMEYYECGSNEKLIIRAFMNKELEEYKE